MLVAMVMVLQHPAAAVLTVSEQLICLKETININVLLVSNSRPFFLSEEELCQVLPLLEKIAPHQAKREEKEKHPTCHVNANKII